MDIKILMIDDDAEVCKKIKALFDGETINENKIALNYVHNFEDGLKYISENDCDLLILDLFKGKPDEKNLDRPGEKILEHIKTTQFIPIIFFSGLVKPIQHLQTEIVRIVRKGDGTDVLKAEIVSVFSSQLPQLSKKINKYVTESIRSYFWDFVHDNWNLLKNIKDDISLGFLLMRRMSDSLSKEQISKLLEDPKIKTDKSHPMEFYIYPPKKDEIETGDILKIKDEYHVLLTPSCDFVDRGGGQIRAETIMLALASPLNGYDEYKKYKADPSPDNKDKLSRIIESRKSDRYFFLPKTPFIPNLVIDFQQISVKPATELSKYTKIAKLDDPYAQSMLANFIRYYNRVGHEDIDTEYILRNLD